jgi:hypothetical protein
MGLKEAIFDEIGINPDTIAIIMEASKKHLPISRKLRVMFHCSGNYLIASDTEA